MVGTERDKQTFQRAYYTPEKPTQQQNNQKRFPFTFVTIGRKE